jgi:hypothetical protein
MPGRDVSVIDGPVRLVDIYPEEVPPGQLEFLEGLTRAEVAELNRAAIPDGYGEQRDPVTRTLWPYGEVPETPVPKGEGRPLPTGDRPAAVPPPPTPAPETVLAARLEALLSKGHPAATEETDLAGAVCALLWPKWPRYEGAVDLNALERVLDARPRLDARQLNRLAGCGAPRPAARPPPA